MKVYLSGGFYTGWQDWVKICTPGHEYYDPRQDTDQRYNYRLTYEDLAGVDWCDLIFVYFEKSNPSGIGTAVEVGYGIGKGKRIVIVDDHDRIHGLLSACGERLFSSLEPAIKYLKEIEEPWR